jgi:hypothetical protein
MWLRPEQYKRKAWAGKRIKSQESRQLQINKVPASFNPKNQGSDNTAINLKSLLLLAKL